MKHDLLAIGEALTRWPWGLLIPVDLIVLIVALWRKKERVAGAALFILICALCWAILGYWIAQTVCCA